MSLLLEFYDEGDVDELVGDALADHVPRVGEMMQIRVNGSTRFVEVVRIEHMFDLARDDSLNHVMVIMKQKETT